MESQWKSKSLPGPKRCQQSHQEGSLQDTYNRGNYPPAGGLTCAQDIFQEMMDQILECCEGDIGITDDVIIHGKDDEVHSQNLHGFMCLAHEHGLVFNGEKCEVKTRLSHLL